MAIVGIDCYDLWAMSGTGTVLRHLLRCFKISSSTHQYLLLVPPAKQSSIPSSSPYSHFTNHKCKLVVVGEEISSSQPQESYEKWNDALEQRLFHLGIAVDVLLFPSKTVPQHLAIPFVCIIHDVMHVHLLEFRLKFGLQRKIRRYLNRATKARYVVTVSHYSKQDILKHSRLKEEKVKVIHNGLTSFDWINNFKQSIKSSYLSKIRFEKNYLIIESESTRIELRDYLLYVGDLRRRKNVFTLVRAYSKLPERLLQKHPLVLTGEGREIFRLKKYLRDKKLSDQTHFVGVVSDEELTCLYKGASLLIFPSLWEGFGLPVIEAQSFGTPVICGRHSSLVEVANRDNSQSTSEDSVVWTDVRTPKLIAKAIEVTLSDEAGYQKLKERSYNNASRFDWIKQAAEYEKIFSAMEHSLTS